MSSCIHGVTLDRTTRDGWPLCALCRVVAKAAAPPPLPKITPPKFDYASLAAHDTLDLED